jgi:biopolymer transport protein ExbD
MTFRGSREEETVEMNLSSMVDIVFLLLIYFIVSASLKQDEMELRVPIPIDQEMKQQQQLDSPEEIVIDVFPNGEIYWNGQICDDINSTEMSELKSILANLKESYPNQAVVIRGQQESEHKRVVAVLNACSAAGIENISFPSDSSVFK